MQFSRVRRSRMLLAVRLGSPQAGIQGGFGLDPRFKHSGVTSWEWPSLHSRPISKEDREHEVER